MLLWTLRGFALAACALIGGNDGTKAQPEADTTSAYATAGLAQLELFVGPWRVTETHLNRRGEVIATVKGSEEITWILDKHAIQRVYVSGEVPNVYRAIGTLTFSDAETKYLGVWFDNASTAGPRMAKGEWTGETRTMVFTLESRGEDGSKVRHKVIERFVDEERRVATTFLLEGDQVIKIMEVGYKRAVPCPARLRPIFTDELKRRPRP